MRSLEKMQLALSRRGSPEVPVTVCYEGILIRDHWPEITCRPWWYLYDPDLEAQLEWRTEAIRRLGQDWYRVTVCAPTQTREHRRIEKRGEAVYLVDTRSGAATELRPPRVGGWAESGDSMSVHPAEIARDRETVDRLVELPPEDAVERNAREGAHDLARALAEGPGRGLYALDHTASPLWLCYGLWGFEDMMGMVAEDPSLVEYACERLLGQSLLRVREAAAMGAHGVWIEECLTDMISPEAYRRLCLPWVRELSGEIRRLGMQSIHYYCGDPAGKLHLLRETGADALSLEESKKGFTVDIADAIRSVGGRMSVLGNLDAVGVLERGIEAELAAEIERQLLAADALAGDEPGAKRFVMGLGSPVTPDTSIPRVRRYCDEVRRIDAEGRRGS